VQSRYTERHVPFQTMPRQISIDHGMGHPGCVVLEVNKCVSVFLNRPSASAV
jgi:hypothetical protein